MGVFAFAPIFTDGMVLQRDQKITVWGRADSEGTVRVYLGDYCSESNVMDGEWKCTFPPMEAATGLTLLAKQGSDFLRVQNVMIGDVWLAGGQSNMEFFLRYETHFEETKALPANPLIRMYTCPRVAYEGQQPYQSGCGYWFGEGDSAWETFSSAAYWFARELQPELQVPVGIISCNWGGTSASAWVPGESLSDGPLKVYLEDYEAAAAQMDPEENRERSLRGWAFQKDPDHMKEWAGVMYGIDRSAQLERLVNRAGNPAVPMGPYNKNRPGCLFEQMIGPIRNCKVRGVLWYQGENDVHHAPLYSLLFTNLITQWRKLWGEDLPFIFAQLAPFGEWLALDGADFPEIRRQQQTAADTIPGCYMISTSDVGMRYDIHPKEKKVLGHRYFLQAMDKVYGQPTLAEAPVMDKGYIDRDRIVLEYRNSGQGLTLQGKAKGFVIWQDDKRLEPEEVVVAGRTTVLRFDRQIKAPVRIEFAQTPYYEVNICNSAGIPALPACISLEVTDDFC